MNKRNKKAIFSPYELGVIVKILDYFVDDAEHFAKCSSLGLKPRYAQNLLTPEWLARVEEARRLRLFILEYMVRQC